MLSTFGHYTRGPSGQEVTRNSKKLVDLYWGIHRLDLSRCRTGHAIFHPSFLSPYAVYNIGEHDKQDRAYEVLKMLDYSVLLAFQSYCFIFILLKYECQWRECIQPPVMKASTEFFLNSTVWPVALDHQPSCRAPSTLFSTHEWNRYYMRDARSRIISFGAAAKKKLPEQRGRRLARKVTRMLAQCLWCTAPCLPSFFSSLFPFHIFHMSCCRVALCQFISPSCCISR